MAFQRESLPEKAALYILDQIRNGTLLPGERLPTIQQLSKKLNISLVSTGRAVKILCAKGYLSAKRRSGIFVLNKNPFPVAGRNKKREAILYYFCGDSFKTSLYHRNVYSYLQKTAIERKWKIRKILFSESDFLHAAHDPQTVAIVMSFADYDVPKDCPVPVIEYGMNQNNVESITPDHYRAGIELGKMYVSAGSVFSGLCLVTPDESAVPAKRNFLQFIEETWKGFSDALLSARVPEPPFVHWHIRKSYTDELKKYLADFMKGRTNREPLLLLVGTHGMAEEIFYFAKELGLSVPADISIISFVRRSLTDSKAEIDVFDFDHVQMAQTIVERLDSALAGNKPYSRVQIPMHFIQAGSCPAAFYKICGINSQE